MPQTDWTIHTKNNGTISVDALTADWPTVSRGAEARLRLWFDDGDTDKTLVVEDGETRTFNSGDSITRQSGILDDGSTLTMNDGSTVTVNSTGLFQLLQYLEWKGDAVTRAPVNGTPWYHEQFPDGAIDSLVLGFEPAGDIRERSVTGLWGVVIDGTDRRNSTLTNWQVELSVFVLAWFRDYPDHDVIENTFQE